MADFFYNPINQDIVMVKNDTMAFGFQIQGLEGETPNNIIFTCRETPEAPEELFSVSREDTINEVSYDPAEDLRTYTLRIPPSLTDDLEPGRYYYDLQVNVNYDIFTLMRGRLTIEYEITKGYAPPVDPEYDPGDENEYPQDNIPAAKMRVYHELPISNIAARIVDINGSSDTYTTVEMAEALEDIKQDITDISDAINAITGETSEIPLSEISGIISSELGLAYEDGTEELY